MPDITIEATASRVAESHHTDELFRDAYNFCVDTIAHPDARLRQASVASVGAILGGIEDIPNELRNHPRETANKVAIDVTAGAGATTLLTAESPLIVGSTLAGGGLLLGVALKNSWDKAQSDTVLSKAMSATWKSSDPATTLNSIKIAEKQLGPEGFDYELAAVGAKSAPSLEEIEAEIGNLFRPKTEWNFHPRADWVTQPDGTKVSIDPIWDRKATQYPDGTIREVLPNSHINIYHPNGDLTVAHRNGIKEITLHDGAKEICYPDGKNITIDRTGRREIKLPNGTTICQQPDGYTSVDRADGSGSSKHVDGSSSNWYANGDILDVDSMGKKTFYSKAEQAYYGLKPNGEKVLRKPPRYKSTD